MEKVLVLPFRIPEDWDNRDYLAEAILDEIIDIIVNQKGYKVSSRSLSLHFKKNPLKAIEIFESFGITLRIEGVIKVVGQQSEFQIQLIDTQKEEVTKTVKASFHPDKWVFTLSELTHQLINPKNSNNGKNLRQSNEHNKAHEYYLKGLYHWNRYTHEEMQKAIACFKQSITVDPSFSKSYAGLADSHSIIAIMGYDDPAFHFKQAKKAVKTALILNDKYSDSYVCAAIINLYFEKDFKKAEINFQRALTLNPQNLKAHHFYSFYAVYTSQLDLAEKHARITLKEDPVSIPHYSNLIRICIYKKNFSEANDLANAALVIDQQSLPIKELVAQIYIYRGNFESAIAGFERCIEADKESLLAYGLLGYCYGVSNFIADNLAIEARMKMLNVPKNSGMFLFCQAIIRLGRQDLVGFFKHVNDAISTGTTVFMGEFIHNPIYSEVKKDPRFKKAIGRFGLDTHEFQSKKIKKPAQLISLTTQTKETLSIDPQDIAFIEGDGNYATVYWFEKNVLNHQILRTTLKNLEPQLTSYSYLYRCHKSFIMNLDEDCKIKGNAKTLFFESPFLFKRIPISRSKQMDATNKLNKTP